MEILEDCFLDWLIEKKRDCNDQSVKIISFLPDLYSLLFGVERDTVYCGAEHRCKTVIRGYEICSEIRSGFCIIDVE